MFSFMKIATFAALTFGALASAIPSPAPVAETRDLAVERRATDVTGVLTQLASDLQAPVGQLNGLTPTTATPAAVTTIVADIQVLVVAAIGACSGLPVGSGNILVLLNVVLTLILNACNSVCGLPGVDVVNIKIAIKLALDVCLSGLISLVINLLVSVGGILSLVISLLVVLLGSCTSIIVSLNLTACIALLGL